MLGHKGSSRTHGSSHPISICLSMETSDLKLPEFDVKVLNEILKDISTLTHELSRLLVREYFMDELIRSLKVGEQKDEYFLWIS